MDFFIFVNVGLGVLNSALGRSVSWFVQAIKPVARGRIDQERLVRAVVLIRAGDVAPVHGIYAVLASCTPACTQRCAGEGELLLTPNHDDPMLPDQSRGVKGKL